MKYKLVNTSPNVYKAIHNGSVLEFPPGKPVEFEDKVFCESLVKDSAKIDGSTILQFVK